MLSSEKKTIIIDFLKEKVSPELIYIFGSYAKNSERNNSDIDIAFLSEKKVDEYNLFLLAQKLAEKLRKEVDLVDIKKVSTVFKVQIIQGELIFNIDNYKKDNFELTTFREYAKLNEERKEILAKRWGDD
ncbi:MAG TPA: nucleotidyltransferase domain-containing protein [Halanaerobiales bacterium]|nr:nucleotidyltransferase domain-containing protein [Halanaerobiales bacterium]